MDIVERLREKTKSLEWLQKMGGSDKHVLVIMSDAADEIERLREALKDIVSDYENAKEKDGWLAECLYATAFNSINPPKYPRAALKGDE